MRASILARVALAILALAAPADPGAAQKTSPDTAQKSSPDTAARRSAFSSLRPGQDLRLTVVPEGRVQGTFRQIDAGALEVQTVNGRVWLQRAAIDSMWVHGNGGGEGFAIGSLLTFTVTVVAEYSACSSFTDGNCGSGNLPAILGTSAVVGLLGGAIGAIIAEATAPWERRIP